MTLKNKLLTYLGFCPSKESAQRFSVRNNTLTLKRKEYRDAIIGGIGGGTELGVELSDEFKGLPPSKLALHIFSQIIPELVE